MRTASVAVQSDWQVVEQFDFSQLAKLSTTVPKATDMYVSIGVVFICVCVCVCVC